MNRIKVYLLMTFLAAGMVFQGCKEQDAAENPGAAPELPPIESMVIDFPFSADAGGRLDPQTKFNAGIAGFNVFIFQGILTEFLALPVKAFHESVDHTFTYLEDEGKWGSEYTATDGEHTVIAKLYAEKIEADTKVRWEMFLTIPGEFEDFLWFTGESNIDNSGGTWTLYKSPSHPDTELLTIEWVREEGHTVESTYLVVEEGSEYKGSYIHYGETDEEGFTHFYEVYVVDAKGTYQLEIFANETTKAGRVRSADIFKDEEWHCWDENLEDVAC